MGRQTVPAGRQAGLHLDEADLLELVRRALGDAVASPGPWRVASLSERATAPISGGLFRVAGLAGSAGGARPWSLVLKIVCPPAGRTRDAFPQGWTPEHHCYWRREPLAYGAGLLPPPGGPLRAARCFGIAERPEPEARVWL